MRAPSPAALATPSKVPTSDPTRCRDRLDRACSAPDCGASWIVSAPVPTSSSLPIFLLDAPNKRRDSNTEPGMDSKLVAIPVAAAFSRPICSAAAFLAASMSPLCIRSNFLPRSLSANAFGSASICSRIAALVSDPAERPACVPSIPEPATVLITLRPILSAAP